MSLVKRLLFVPILCFGLASCKTTSEDKFSELKSTSILSGKNYCRMVGSLGGGGQVKACLEFGSNGSGIDRDTSGGIPRATPFSYSVADLKVTLVVSDSPLRSRVREMELASDGSTLTLKEGSNMFVWNLAN